MASYPGAVKAFTTKNAGDTIQANDINDLQDEVNAMEGGLLNGTAPLNSSNSTLANLSVLGNSTIVGSLVISSNLTVSGTFQPATLHPTGVFTDDVQPQAMVFHGSTQTISNLGDIALTFNSEDVNIGSVHSTGSNPTRLTVGSSGLWMFGATVVSRAIPLGNKLLLRFRKNGATAVGSMAGMKQQGIDAYIENTVIARMTSSADYMEVLVTQDTAGSIETGNASSRADQNQFWGVKLS